ncbi:hypothetical protein KY345_00470 [Candidatus Woesearchaeota archaeon]|nr:hypothetical protein [Candidatus Woesearchaeota archaeon]
MKKIYAILMMVLLALSAVPVFAEGEQAGQDNGAPQAISAGPDGEQEQERNQTGPVRMEGDTMVHIGLNNALQQVENENARAVLQRNMERFLERYQARLNNMTNIEVEVDEEAEETTIKAKEPVRFLGFIKGKATKRFEVEKSGKINERAPWYRFLYAEE